MSAAGNGVGLIDAARRRGTILFAALVLAACTDPDRADSGLPEPPRADREAHSVVAPGGVRSDPYYWIRDDSRKNPRVLELLRAENEYAEKVLAGLAPLRAELRSEMQSRIPAQQRSAPFFDDGYWYYTRFEAGGEYPIHARRRGRIDAVEEVLIDGNALGTDAAPFRVGGWDVSPDGRRLLWLENVAGQRQFQLRIRDLSTGRVYDSAGSGIASASWSADGQHILLVESEPATLRPFRVLRLDPDRRTSERIHEENDPAFSVSVRRSRSDRYDLVLMRSADATELRFVDRRSPTGELETFLPRSAGHEYSADHVAGRWVVRTDWRAPNFRLMEVGEGLHADREAWLELLAHRNDVVLHEFDPFDTFVAVAERQHGLRRIRVLDSSIGREWVLDFDEEVHAVQLGRNLDPGRRTLQYVYTSPSTPQTTWELDLDNGQRRLVNRLRVAGDFDPADYRVRRFWARARDGERIPVSLSWHRETALDGTAPLLQEAYGAYGLSQEPAFDRDRLGLLDRGFVHALVHVRGGQELGRTWYDRGRLLNKMNSFHDFIDATRDLVDEGLVDRERVFAAGSSAGGLLVAAVANMAGERYAGVLAEVPFVDIVTTMLDPSIPLTTLEYEEWGDPSIPEQYRYMLTYSPYDNVTSRAYPPMFVTAGLWDSQVAYWEPAKWVARLRQRKTDDHPVLLQVDMQAGHGGRSGRFARLDAKAAQYAFLLDRAGLGR